MGTGEEKNSDVFSSYDLGFSCIGVSEDSWEIVLQIIDTNTTTADKVIN